MTQEELAAELTAVKDQAAKAKAEIVAKIATLEQAIIDSANTSPAVNDALAALKAEVQSVDDLNPDAVVEEPTA